MQYCIAVNTYMFALENSKYPRGSVDFASLRGFNLVLETNLGPPSD